MVNVLKSSKTSTHTRFALSKRPHKLRSIVQLIWGIGINSRTHTESCNFQMEIIAGMGQIGV
nr:hypothetical protein Iba_chr08bCG2600 [Ipomoea batatas]GMD26131.1 hypothetical protein Iba_chr08dCG1360 [Ipomoea batatas]